MSAALDAVPRSDFLPAGARGRAGFDGPIAIGCGQTNSQPRTVEAMLRLLEVRPGDRILDVGSGSGWTTALLAHLTGPTGSVLGVELEPRLADWGATNLAATGLRWADVAVARRGELGAPDRAPYDRILVSADGGRVPQQLVDQLAEHATMVLPAAGHMTVVVRRGDQVRSSRHGHYRFVPLR